MQTFHRVVRQRIVLISAENQTDRRILANLRPMLASKVAVNVHLTDVGMSESANFEINDYEATADDGKAPSPRETIHDRCAVASAAQ